MTTVFRSTDRSKHLDNTVETIETPNIANAIARITRLAARLDHENIMQMLAVDIPTTDDTRRRETILADLITEVNGLSYKATKQTQAVTEKHANRMRELLGITKQ